jgi:kynurenine/2-aminoadipate aminotransferase
MSRIIKDYTSFFSARALRRKPSAIRELMPLLKIPGMISLGGLFAFFDVMLMVH